MSWHPRMRGAGRVDARDPMTPLLRATLAYCAGLLIGLRAPLPPWLLVMCGVLCLALMVSSFRGVLILALAAAGAVSGSWRGAAVRGDCRELLPDGAVVSAVARPLALPTEGMAVTARARLRSEDVECEAAVRARTRPQQHAVLAEAAVQSRAVRVTGRWMAHEPRNGWPRSPLHAGLLLIDSIAPVDSAHVPLAARVRIAQQERLRRLLPDRWGLAEAMLLAQKSGLVPETRARWVAAGLVHLLAISGMHVGLIAAGVIGIGAACGLPRRTARRIAVLATALYVLFLGAPSAALRALLQAVLLLAALELQRPSDRWTALAAAALAILLVDPLALLDPGFQLSFAGMIGLLAWSRPVAELLPGRWPSLLRDGIAAGVAASALTTPVAALHFGTASWIGILASVAAVPVMAAAIGLIVCALLIDVVLGGSVASVVAFPAEGMLRLLDAIAAGAAAVPGGHGHLAAPTVLYLLIACATFVIVRAHARGGRGSRAVPVSTRRRLRVVRIGTAAACAIVVIAWAPLLLRASRGALEIHVIDVGQGDAVALRTPRGRWLLVDTGPRSGRFDAGRDRVVPYLLKQGARRIEALVLTHPDADHIGGAEAVLDVFDVGLVIDPGFPAGKDMFIDLLAAARRGDRRWVAAQAGQRFAVDGIAIDMLFPLPASAGARDANDNSVVFRLAFGEFSALFTGDAPTSVEEAIVEQAGGRLPGQVLKVGHHGSRTSTGAVLLRAMEPELALISSGRNNRYGHPNPGVLARLEAHDVRVLRTDRSGSFVVRARRDGRTEVFARQHGN